MFRRFENLVDPFQPFDAAAPPKGLWPYVKTQIAPFRRVLPVMAFTGIIVALMESGLIFYSGRIIDLMNTAGPESFWDSHGIELILAVIFIVGTTALGMGMQGLAALNLGFVVVWLVLTFLLVKKNEQVTEDPTSDIATHEEGATS